MFRKNDGFTLIEVLVAVGLTAILITALYSTFFSISGATRRAEENVDRYMEAGLLLEKLSGEVRSAYYGGSGDYTFFQGDRKGEDSSLSFTAYAYPVMRKDAPSSDLAAVNYIVRKQGGAATLVKEVWNPFTGQKYEFEAAKDIRAFEVSFYNGKDWSKAWDSALEGSLPKAVKVRLKLSGGEELSATAETKLR